MAQRIVIPGFRKIETSGGGEGGSTNYDDLTNKPSINNVPLVGKLKTVDLKLTDVTLTEEGVPAEAKTVGELINTLNSNIGNIKKHYFTPVFGSAENVAKNVWVKSNKDITVPESGIYIVNFPFLRDQGGTDTVYLTQIKIDTSDSLSLNQEPDIGCVATNWGITSMTYLCELQAGKTYHIWLRHTASQTHTIDYHCYYAKI